MDNLDYMEAVKSLADRAGLALPQDGYDDTLMKQRRRMLEANREAARYFHETLFTPEGAAALSYLQGRGLNAKIIRHFGLGCAPNRWDGLLRHMRQKGYSEAELVNANLARRSDKNGRTSCYDNFRNRMMIPIIDLRGNTGGYMEAAIRMVNEFLPEGKLIVYTQGRKYPRAEEFANGTGSCQKMPLVVLIDEGSASASEIFTGAIQDNDRGTVVGRRSFGKGLVQQPIDFSDGSAIRLTIARYYTPSGRCIQRPYESGKDRNYELDLYTRYEHGEFFSRDSIKQNESERYNTSLGRTVYGGGGIMPDIFVPQDTTGVTSYLSTVINRGLTIQFTFQYTDNNRKKLSQYETEEELLNYLRHQGLVEQFVRFADSKGVKRRNILIQKSYKLLEKNLFGNIIYNMLGLEAYLQYFNKTDATVIKGIEILEKGEAFPKAPVAVEEEVTKDKKDGKKKRTAQAYSITEDPTRGFNYAKAAIS